MFKTLTSRRYVCPVCGFLLKHPPDDFNICPSCGVEFGYETSSRSFEELREEWFRTGAHWASSVHPKPRDFDPIKQLRNIGIISPAQSFDYEQISFRLIPEWTQQRPSFAVTYTTNNA